jgi:hypothetical protein
MKTEFEHHGKIITTADLEEPLYENDSIKIYGEEYVVFENQHEVEIHSSGCEEKVICSVVTEDEWIEWERWHK